MIYKTLLITAATAAILLLGGWAMSRANLSRPEIQGTGSITYNFDRGCIEVAPGVEFVLAIGSPASTITQGNLENLRSHGVTVDSARCFIWSRMLDGSTSLFTKRYTLSFPGSDTHPALHNVTFYPARDGEPSMVGSDILEQFAVEYRMEPRPTITLHTTPPADYQYLSKLDTRSQFSSLLGMGRSYYVDVTVGNDKNSFKVESNIYDAHLKMPSADTVHVVNPLRTGQLKTAYGDVEMRFADKMWVRLGDRGGSHPAYFGNWRDAAPYSINLFNFYNQDLLLDFPSGRIGLRSHTDRH